MPHCDVSQNHCDALSKYNTNANMRLKEESPKIWETSLSGSAYSPAT